MARLSQKEKKVERSGGQPFIVPGIIVRNVNVISITMFLRKIKYGQFQNLRNPKTQTSSGFRSSIFVSNSCRISSFSS